MKRRNIDRRPCRLGTLLLTVALLCSGFYDSALAGEAAKETKKKSASAPSRAGKQNPAAGAEASATGTARETKKKSESASGPLNQQNPIVVTADWMEADRQKNTIVYKGQVVAIQKDMTMRGDKLTALFDPSAKQMKQAVVEGRSVQIVQGDKIATGTKAVFDGAAQTVTMTGNPVIRQGNSEVSGERIIFYMKEDRAIAEGGANQRVKATIFTEEMGKQPKREEGAAKEP
jgi:lipopolysaccharide export system protein LptA